jgi:predicted transcriptional regulator
MGRLVLSEHDELPVVDVEERLLEVVSRRDVLRVCSTLLVVGQPTDIARFRRPPGHTAAR